MTWALMLVCGSYVAWHLCGRAIVRRLHRQRMRRKFRLIRGGKSD